MSPKPVMEGMKRSWWLLWEDRRLVNGGNLEEKGHMKWMLSLGQVSRSSCYLEQDYSHYTHEWLLRLCTFLLGSWLTLPACSAVLAWVWTCAQLMWCSWARSLCVWWYSACAQSRKGCKAGASKEMTTMKCHQHEPQDQNMQGDHQQSWAEIY